MVATALLEQCIMAGKTGVEDLQSELEMAKSTLTGRLWVYCILVPIGREKATDCYTCTACIECYLTSL